MSILAAAILDRSRCSCVPGSGPRDGPWPLCQHPGRFLWASSSTCPNAPCVSFPGPASPAGLSTILSGAQGKGRGQQGLQELSPAEGSHTLPRPRDLIPGGSQKTQPLQASSGDPPLPSWAHSWLGTDPSSCLPSRGDQPLQVPTQSCRVAWPKMIPRDKQVCPPQVPRLLHPDSAWQKGTGQARLGPLWRPQGLRRRRSWSPQSWVGMVHGWPPGRLLGRGVLTSIRGTRAGGPGVPA